MLIKQRLLYTQILLRFNVSRKGVLRVLATEPPLAASTLPYRGSAETNKGPTRTLLRLCKAVEASVLGSDRPNAILAVVTLISGTCRLLGRDPRAGPR